MIKAVSLLFKFVVRGSNTILDGCSVNLDYFTPFWMAVEIGSIVAAALWL